MQIRNLSLLCSLTLALAGTFVVEALAQQSETRDAEFSSAQIEFFRSQVVPILEENCLKCHTGEEPKGELNLTRRESILSGGESGPAVDLADHTASNFVDAINYQGWEMPPTGQMSPKQIAVLTKWASEGLPWPAELEEIEFEVEAGPPEISDENKQFWSFKPVRKPELPAVSGGNWAHNEIDTFVLRQLEDKGLTPSTSAKPRELIRRVHYDLVGLPPSIDLVERFAADPSAEHYALIVDELLESKRYGEHWGRHWLDLVRYAETNSYERDGAKPFVWRYRDYVIRSFNNDKPYDRFIAEQLAGDELDDVSPETMVATGYYRLGRWDDEPADPALAFYDDIDDIVTTTGQTFLGLTINCARCHDHKIDPIGQKDYYSMVAFFRNVRRFGVRSADSVNDSSVAYIDLPGEKARYEADVAKFQRAVKASEKTIRQIEDKVRDDLDDVEVEEFRHEMNRLAIVSKRSGTLLTERDVKRYGKQLEQLRVLKRNPPKSLAQALVVKEDVNQLKPTYVLLRGSPHAPGDEVQPGFPRILSPPEAVVPEQLPENAVSSLRRIELARWIASPDNPLTARVMVNRIWQYHFGRGIVRTSSDFGFQGTHPTHPKLLDWLAAKFVDEGWSIKKLHRIILASATYQQASRPRENAYAVDPNNDLLWRFDMRRLAAEEIRDSILWTTGALNAEKMFGPSIYTDIPDAVKAGQSRPGSGWGKSTPEDENRRSIYIHAKRSLADPLLEAFDMADMDLSCPVRFVTTQPTQALGMLNSEFMEKQASLFSEYVRQAAGGDIDAQVHMALERVTQRPCDQEDVDRAVALIENLRKEHGMNEEDARRYFCLLALNLNEFLYLD